MTMILSYFLLWLSNLSFAGVALCDTAFTPAASLPFSNELKDLKVWSNFEEADPILALYRAERMTFTKGGCFPAVQSLLQKDLGSKEGTQAWSPYSSSELALVEDCVSFPCKVKLNEKEVGLLKGEVKSSRLKKYEELVNARVQEAFRTKVRGGYELKEPALSGWDWLKTRADFKLTRPEKSELISRKLDLAKKGGYQEIRQILEQKVLSSPGRYHFWIQDLYTDHYFDSWSEELDFSCQSDEEGTLIQTLVIDLDLLKSTDFFSKIMRPKIRVGVREAAKELLKARREEWFGDAKQ